MPSTLAISCGSQIAVVTPWGSTQRSNSMRRDERGLSHVQMRVDEARHRDAPAAVRRAVPAIASIRPHDRVAADCNVGGLRIPVTRSNRRTLVITKSAAASPSLGDPPSEKVSVTMSHAAFTSSPAAALSLSIWMMPV